jgi:F0F1-type ATP synthase membrane subunit b/b'
MAAEAHPTTMEQAARRIAEAESRAERILEEARDQAAELTNAARGEVERKLEWARAQASAIINRAQESAEELLNAAESVAARPPSEPEDSGPGGKGGRPVR